MLNERWTFRAVCEMMLHQLGMKGPLDMPINAHILEAKSGLFSIWLENAIDDERPGTVDVFIPGYLSASRARVAAEKFALAIGRVARWV